MSDRSPRWLYRSLSIWFGGDRENLQGGGNYPLVGRGLNKCNNLHKHNFKHNLLKMSPVNRVGEVTKLMAHFTSRKTMKSKVFFRRKIYFGTPNKCKISNLIL